MAHTRQKSHGMLPEHEKLAWRGYIINAVGHEMIPRCMIDFDKQNNSTGLGGATCMTKVEQDIHLEYGPWITLAQ